MRIDNLGRSIFDDTDLFRLLYQQFEFSADNSIIVNPSKDILALEESLGFQFVHYTDSNLEVNEFDKSNQSNWFMPSEYKMLDIEGFLVNVCPKQNYQRLIDELVEFRSRNMLDLLRWLKYFVDTARKNNIVWGVGRGSSVSSYVLYLIGVHKIDPIKYNLDYKEFLR